MNVSFYRLMCLPILVHDLRWWYPIPNSERHVSSGSRCVSWELQPKQEEHCLKFYRFGVIFYVFQTGTIWTRFPFLDLLTIGHVWTTFDTVGLWGSIFHYHICDVFMSKWGNVTVCKTFIINFFLKPSKRSNLLILAHNLHQNDNEKLILITQLCKKWFKNVPSFLTVRINIP